MSGTGYADRFRLEGRRVVVLGAGQGMGREAAVAAHELGATVLSVDFDGERAAATAGIVEGESRVVDVTDRDAILALAADAREVLGGVDGVIDVVGMAAWHPIDETPRVLLDQQLQINYIQALHVLEGFAPAMAQGGSFAFVTSASGVRGAQMHSAYGSAKAALMSMVKSAAVELGPRGIRVNSIAPGVILTPRTEASLFSDQDFVDRQCANVPLGRFGDTADVASALVFLLAEASAYITGQNISLDGGVEAKFPHLTRD